MGFDANRWTAPLDEREPHGGRPIPIWRMRVKKLVEARSKARKAKDFKEGDRIRDELAAMGIALKDSKDPETGEVVTTWEVRASGPTEVAR